MEKEKLYHIALDDYEHGVVIRSLNDEKTKLMEEGKSADAVDDLLVKVGNATLKKFKVIERKRSDEAR
jgi:hemerythrin